MRSDQHPKTGHERCIKSEARGGRLGAILEVIASWPTPAALRKAGRARVDANLKAHGARRHATWANTIIDALGAQSVVVAGTDAAGVVLPHLARQLIALHAQRADIASQVEALLEAHPLYEVLT